MSHRCPLDHKKTEDALLSFLASLLLLRTVACTPKSQHDLSAPMAIDSAALDDQIARFDLSQESVCTKGRSSLFLADHGDLAGEHSFLRKGLELCEFLTRIPLVSCGDPVAQQPVIDDLHVNIVNCLPTLCETCGFDLESDPYELRNLYGADAYAAPWQETLAE
jgi:hypothetical protein